MRSPALLFSLPILLAACGPASPDPVAPPPPAPAASAAASAAPVASAAPTASAAKPPPEPPSPFSPVAIHGTRDLRYFPLAKGGVAVDGNYLSRALFVDEDGARPDPRLYAGLDGVGSDNAMYIYGVHGDWPRSGSLSLNLPGERGGTDVDYAWNGAKWVKTPNQPLGDMSRDVVAAYYQGGLLGTARWGGKNLYYVITPGEGDVMYQKFVPALGSGSPPSIARSPVKGCPTRLVGYSGFFNTPGGDLVGIGKLCTAPADYTYYDEKGPGALAIERWTRGSGASTVTELPGTAGRDPLISRSAGLLEIAPGDAYAYATFIGAKTFTPYVAHWDGKAWTDVSPRSGQPITALWADRDHAVWIETKKELFRSRGGAFERMMPDGVEGEIGLRATAPDGSLWVAFGRTLARLPPGGAWEKISLPRVDGEAYFAAAVAWMGQEAVVVAYSDSERQNALFSTRKPGKVLDLATEEAGKRPAPEPRPLGRISPPTSGCESLFVVLYKLSRVAPPDFDFPLTRAALKGHMEFRDVRFVETEEAGTRYLVGFVPTLRTGRRLVTLVEDKVKGSRPQLLCGEPRQKRVIDVDLRTGDLRKK